MRTGRWWMLGVTCLSVIVVNLDLTILNIALPAISAALHAGTGDLQWLVDAYSLVFAGVMLPAGMAGDRLGRKRLLLAGLAVFLAASLWCALSVSAGELIAARALMGLGAGIVFPLSLAVVSAAFGDDEPAQGHRHPHRGGRARPAARAGARRPAAAALLLALGVLDQRARRLPDPGRRRRADARVAQPRRAAAGRPGRAAVRRGGHLPGLGRHQRPGTRLDGAVHLGCCWPGRQCCWPPSSPASTARRTRSSTRRCSGTGGSPGARPPPSPSRSRCTRSCSYSPSTCKACSATTRPAPGCGCCR